MRRLNAWLLYTSIAVYSGPLFAANWLSNFCSPVLQKIAKWRGTASFTPNNLSWKALIGEESAEVAAEFEKLLPTIKPYDTESYRNAYKKVKLTKSDRKTLDWMTEELHRFKNEFEATTQRIDAEHKKNLANKNESSRPPYNRLWDEILAHPESSKQKIRAAAKEIEAIRLNPNANYEDFMRSLQLYSNPFLKRGTEEEIKSTQYFWNNIAKNQTSIFRLVPQDQIHLRGLSYGFGSGVSDVGLPRHGELPRADGRVFIDPEDFTGHDIAHHSTGQTGLRLSDGFEYALRMRTAILKMHNKFADYMRSLPPSEQSRAKIHDAIYFYFTHEDSHDLFTWGTTLEETKRGIHKDEEAIRYIKPKIVLELETRGLEDAKNGKLSDFHWIMNRDSNGVITSTRRDIEDAVDFFLENFKETVLELNHVFNSFPVRSWDD